jgi:hypothetical protein
MAQPSPHFPIIGPGILPVTAPRATDARSRRSPTPVGTTGPAPPDDPRAADRPSNQISAIARTSWLALLGYLAFIGVTLLGVEDADFFVPARQTDLPLVNVAIPTFSFFLFAPILGAALYAYLHIHLLKLWDAIAAAPSEIGSIS